MHPSDPIVFPAAQRRHGWTPSLCVASVFAFLALAGCGGSRSGSGTTDNPSTEVGGSVRLADVTVGRLVDVLGLRTTADGTVIREVFERDVVIGTDIRDERSPAEQLADEDIRYDFLSPNPDTLQPQLLIPRAIGSPEFDELFAALDDEARTVTPAVFGQDVSATPFPVVPRNAGIRLTFTGGLGIDDSFFYEFSDDGQISGLRNTEAVQLLRIAGDPNDEVFDGDFSVIPVRLSVKRNEIVLDPVLLGSEGLQIQTQNRATGLPPSTVTSGANIRLALALDGPLSIDQLRADESPQFTGLNNGLLRSIVRDFRSGGASDSSADLANGFVRDPEPPRLLGRMSLLVDDVSPGSQSVRVEKDGLQHGIDAGDVLTFFSVSSGGGIEVLGTSSVLASPEDDPFDDDSDVGTPEVFDQTVDVVIEQGVVDAIADALPDVPAGLTAAERIAFLRDNGVRAVLAADFTANRDRPENFVTFTPTPNAEFDGSPSRSNENVSPFASLIVRFSKPVDLETVRPLDTLFFATRNLFDADRESAFRDGTDPVFTDPSFAAIPSNLFSLAKYRTPHLIGAQRRDQNGSQTLLRLEPLLGFYLDQSMRDAFEDAVAGGDPLPEALRYYVHLLGGENGVRDLSGNPIDLQPVFAPELAAVPVGAPTAVDSLVAEFSLDMRTLPGGQPTFPDNRVAHVVRRHEQPDEDERPSYYIRRERSQDGGDALFSLSVPDVFGPLVYLANGRVQARGTSRIRRFVDDRNQLPPPPQTSDQRYCVERFDGSTGFGVEAGVAAPTGGTLFGGPVQNPFNPFGSRTQMVWRETDLSLSRVNPDDFNLDVEQMYLGVFSPSSIQFDEFDQVSMFLGHSERRPEPCVGGASSLGLLDNSGLVPAFDDNYVRNLLPDTGAVDESSRRAPHVAFVDQRLRVTSDAVILDPTGANRFMRLPDFVPTKFVWRDETLNLQGGDVGNGSDINGPGARGGEPYIISPWLHGEGRNRRLVGGSLQPINGFWNNFGTVNLSGGAADTRTDGALGSIALPLLAEFQVLPDSSELPVEAPFRASGANGFQVSLSVQSGAPPGYRAVSGGGGSAEHRTEPGSPDWTNAMGGFFPNTTTRTNETDNSVYWMAIDLLKRQSVATSGFVSILDPHRIVAEDGSRAVADPRLGPYEFDGQLELPPDVVPHFAWAFDPPLSSLPDGTEIVPQFRAASRVDPEPWHFTRWLGQRGGLGEAPDADNFPLDPLKAGDAGLRKFDDRALSAGPARNHWAYLYNREVTDYTLDIEEIVQPAFLERFAGPLEAFGPRQVEYFNWRFVLVNNVEAQSAVSPSIDSFMVAYRFER